MSGFTSFIKRHSLAVFLSLVYLLGWLIQFFARAAQEQGDQGTWTILLALFTFVPGIVAAVLVLLSFDRAERSAFRHRLFTLRVGVRWYMLALIIGSGAWLAGAGIVSAFGIPLDFNVGALMAAPIFLITVFIEEVGWRGFAMPYFLLRYSTARAGLLLGHIWAFWHLPDYLREPFGLYAALFATLVVILTAQSIIMTWIFQRAGGVMLPVVLLHWISNEMARMFYSGGYSVDAMTIFLQVRLAVAGVMLIAAGIVLIYEVRTRGDFQLERDSQVEIPQQSS
jgi:membrane protease YdiL (CAAX protease family)